MGTRARLTAQDLWRLDGEDVLPGLTIRLPDLFR